MNRPVLLACIAVVYIGAALCALAEPPSGNRKSQAGGKKLRVLKTDDFEINGQGDASAWQKASWEPLQRRPGDGPAYTTHIKVLYSATGLYVLMDASDAKITATMKEDFLELWHEDVFEPLSLARQASSAVSRI